MGFSETHARRKDAVNWIALGCWLRRAVVWQLAVLLVLAGESRAAAPPYVPPEPPLPAGAVARLGNTRFAMGEKAQSIAWSPDGSTIATLEYFTGHLRFWDAATGRLLLTYYDRRCFKYEPGVLLFSPDGRFLVCPSVRAGYADVLEWRTRRVHFQMPTRADQDTLAFSPDGKMIYLLAFEELHGYDMATRQKRTLLCFEDRPRMLATARDGLLATAHLDGVRFWKMPERKLLRHVPCPEGYLKCFGMALDPEGNWVALLLSDRNRPIVDLHSVTTAQKPVRLARLPSQQIQSRATTLFRLVPSPCGKQLAVVTGEGLVTLYDPITGERTRNITSVPTPDATGSNALAFSPDAREVALTNTSQLCICSTVGGRPRPTTGHRGWINALDFSPEGKHLCSASSDRTVRFWALGKARETHVLDSFLTDTVAVRYSPDGQHVAIVDFDYALWSYPIGTNLKPRCLRRFSHLPKSSAPLAWSADGRDLLLGCTYGLESVPLRVAPGFTEEIGPVLDINGPFLATRAEEGPIVVRSLRDGKNPAGGKADAKSVAIYQGHTRKEEVRYRDAVRLSSTGRHLAMASEAGLELWDTRAGPEPILLLDEDCQYTTLAFSPDGRFLALGTRWGTVVLWELATRRPLTVLEGQLGEIGALAFDAKSGLLASGASDGTIVLWDWQRRTACAPLSAEERWRALGSEDPVLAWKAVDQLVRQGKETIAWLTPRAKPTAPREDLPALVARLDAEDWKIRQSATRELRSLGCQASGALRRYLESKPALEANLRAQRLLEQLRPQITSLTEEDRRGDRIVAVLERIGTPEARRLLERLASGAEGAWTTTCAREALARMRK